MTYLFDAFNLESATGLSRDESLACIVSGEQRLVSRPSVRKQSERLGRGKHGHGKVDDRDPASGANLRI